MMDTLFAKQISLGWLKIFMDDLLITNNGDRQDLIDKALIVLQILMDNDLYVKPEKCSFFISFCNFYNRFIDHYSDKCTPLNLLLLETQPWEWKEAQQVAVETLKAAYASEPVLLCPNYQEPFTLKCDTSLVASGGVLLQNDSNDQQHPVALFSKAHSPAERNYMTFDQEFLAIILCL